MGGTRDFTLLVAAGGCPSLSLVLSEVFPSHCLLSGVGFFLCIILWSLLYNIKHLVVIWRYINKTE